MKMFVLAGFVIAACTPCFAKQTIKIGDQMVEYLEPSDMPENVSQGRTLWQAGDYAAAYEVLSPLAKAGDPWALNIMGVALTDPDERFAMPYDPVAGIAAYEAAAAQNLPRAIFNLGLTLAETHPGFDPDYERAAKMFQRAIAMKYLAAENDLGLLHVEKRIAGADPQKAFALFSSAHARGEIAATSNLADMYYRGQFIEEDRGTAFDLYTIAAEQGQANALFALGYMYLHGQHVGSNLPAGYALLMQAQEAGNLGAEIELFRLVSNADYADRYFYDPAHGYALCLDAIARGGVEYYDENLAPECKQTGADLAPDVRDSVEAENALR